MSLHADEAGGLLMSEPRQALGSRLLSKALFLRAQMIENAQVRCVLESFQLHVPLRDGLRLFHLCNMTFDAV